MGASLGFAIGRNGVPVGAITNVYGQEGSSKSTLLYHLGAETQRRGGIFVLYYAEGLRLKEIGQVLGITESRVCQLHSRAVLRLNQELEGAPVANRKGSS